MKNKTLSIINFSKSYFNELDGVIKKIDLGVLEKIVKILRNAYLKGNNIYIMGNGGSGATASHFACDMNKGMGLNLKKRFRVICLNDSIPTMLAYANDCSYGGIFVEQLKNFLTPKDVVIGISASGNSENIIKAVDYANKNKAETIAFTGFDGGKVLKIAKNTLIVPINDMQKIEDAHLIIVHIIMQFFCNMLKDEI